MFFLRSIGVSITNEAQWSRVRSARENRKFNNDLEEVDFNIVRYRPESLDTLCETTKFSRKELQVMYRGFKQGCPSGIVNVEQFKDIYAQFFPQGDSGRYAQLVFNTFDKDQNGTISFEELVNALSVLCRGTIEDKLRWIFHLYDVNNKNSVSKGELTMVIASVYDLMGKLSEPPVDEFSIVQHVEEVFEKMDGNHDGLITIEDFMDACRQDEIIVESLHLFDTKL